MDRRVFLEGDGLVMHRLVARRLAQQPRRVDWREAREIGLLLTSTIAGPLAIVALKAGSGAIVAGAFALATALALVAMVALYRRDHAIDLLSGPILLLPSTGGVCSNGATSSRARTPLFPARHKLASATRRPFVDAQGRGRPSAR